ncbi:MAG: hypothetical protein FWC80_00625 [Firmicutes bacterium]|nr:hypothetical protein [Bacillota bacterium]
MAIALAMTVFAFAGCDLGDGSGSDNQNGQELMQLNPIRNPRLLGRSVTFDMDSRTERIRVGFMYWDEYAERVDVITRVNTEGFEDEEFFYYYLTLIHYLGGGLRGIDLEFLFEAGYVPRQTFLDVSIIAVGTSGVHKNSDPVIVGPIRAPAIPL